MMLLGSTDQTQEVLGLSTSGGGFFHGLLEVDFFFFSPSKLRSRSLLLESGAPEPERYKMEPYFTPPPKKMARKRHGFACFFFTQRWRKNSPGISTDIFLGPEPRNPRKVLAVTGSARSWKIRRGAHLFWWENVVNGLFTGPLRKW